MFIYTNVGTQACDDVANNVTGFHFAYSYTVPFFEMFLPFSNAR